jgi:hypothetical protein
MHMKFLLMVCLSAWFVCGAGAQVSVDLELSQNQFLPNESLPAVVKITNRSGQTLHLGAEPDWLTFGVEAKDGFVVMKKAEVPVVGEFDLENSQMAIKRVDLQPYFTMSKAGRYQVIATLRIKDWGVQIGSAPKHFDVVNGAELWSEDFGVPAGTNGVPEARKYTLVQANYLKDQLRLYVEVSDPASGQVYKVNALGMMVAFAHPEVLLDRQSRLNVLWQTGAQVFSFALVNPDGSVARTEYYDTSFSRPRLVVDEQGGVMVIGGTRRAQPGELPILKSPNELPPMTAPPAAVPVTSTNK